MTKHSIDAHVYERLTQIRDELGSAGVAANIVLAGPVTPHDTVAVLFDVIRLQVELSEVVGLLQSE